MGFVTPEFAPALAEIALATGICVVLLADLFISDERRGITLLLSLATLAVTAACVGFDVQAGGTLTFDGSYISDALARVLKLFTLLIVATVFVYSHAYLRDRGLHKGEYYLLGLFATLGMCVLISAHNLITVYLGLELMSLALYSMAAFDRESPVAAESAIKYFVLGAIASGVLLYGMSLMFGATNSTLLTDIGAALLDGDLIGLEIVAVVFIVAGFAFKISAVPFHQWAPDTYEGAPTPVTAFLSVASKAAGFVALMTIIFVAFPGASDVYEPFVWVLAVLTMTIGNVLALRQTNIVRLLAYSSVSQGGFILMPLAFAGNENAAGSALNAVIVYLLIYALTNLGSRPRTRTRITPA